MNRREFLPTAAAAIAAGFPLNGQAPRRVLIEASAGGFRRRLAERELLRGLRRLLPRAEVRLGGRGQPGAGLRFGFHTDSARFASPEAFSIASEPDKVTFTAADEHALPFAVFDFLERQGVFFGIDGESYPPGFEERLALPRAGEPWQGTPRFAVRGLLPWPDFLNCITVFNEEDFRAYFEAMLRMRFNMFGMHVYTGAAQWAESYLSFEFAGAGHLAFLDNSASHRWGYLPQRTSRFGMGAAQLFDSEVFGSDATRLGRDPWEIAERTQRLLRDGLNYAHGLGIRTGIGFEPYQIPDEIWRALPPEIKPKELPGRRHSGPRFDIESVTARKLLETRLAQLLEAYPEVDFVWLWEDETMNWESRRTGIPLSVTPFAQAHDFLRRHAPGKRLVISGWGGVARHFEHFHQKLPGDIIFSCLSDSLGWDPVHEVFARLEGRERWPIPWLEDDPAMWLPQFHVHRFQRDMNLAERYGCQGMLGIHWRHRIVDPTAGYFARFSWDRSLTPAEYYRAYSGSQAEPARAAPLAGVLEEADRGSKLLGTGTSQTKDGHVVTRAFAGDYNEAFTFWNNYEPEPEVVTSQKQVALELRTLASQAASPEEKERLDYLAAHVEFLVPYAEAWTLAHRLHLALEKAGRSREALLGEALPLWPALARQVRQAMVIFQRIVATRNDLGTLASLHNKFVRLALVRLRMSLEERLGELPSEIEKLFGEMMKPDAEAPARLFAPTRPTLLGRGERVRVLVVAPGEAAVAGVAVHTRLRGAKGWTTTPARLLGRRTYEAFLGPFDSGAALAEYYFSAQIAGRLVVAPPGGASQPCALTLV